ncbi:MAG: nuclear transport factor 2 family protein [Mycobacterium sp.]
MGQWSRAEIESAFKRHEEVVVGIGSSWDWSRFADEFTEDATYVEHTYGTLQGREEIRNWIVSTMNAFPGSEMPCYPTSWYSIDEDRGWVFCEILNRMRDPGDGSIHQAATITILKYAGDGLWSYEEDAYNPMNFLPMVREYVQRCKTLGTASEDALAFAKNMNWELA